MLSYRQMLHLVLQENADSSVVRLSGQLVDEFVAEARRLCCPPLLIDATELKDADEDKEIPGAVR